MLRFFLDAFFEDSFKFRIFRNHLGKEGLFSEVPVFTNTVIVSFDFLEIFACLRFFFRLQEYVKVEIHAF